MNQPLSIVCGVLFVSQFLWAWTCFSIRDFSRSRLQAICQERSRPERFGRLLRTHQPATLAVELMVGLNTVALVAVALPVCGLNWAAAQEPLTVLWFGVRWVGVLALGALVTVILPRPLAKVRGEWWLYTTWPLLRALLTVVKPVISLAESTDRLVHRVAGEPEPGQTDAAVLTEEIRTVVDEGQREGILESEARTMIHRVMELQDEDAAAIMTPRTEMNTIDVESSLEQARQKLLEFGHSRVPVTGESIDDIVGVLHAKDLLMYLNGTADPETRLRSILREPFYVPETTGIDTLLETMKREKVHLAIVLDEYSGVSGLVTLEDILEEIVGEIVDEYDAEEQDGIERVRPGVIEVEGRVHIDDLNEQFQLGLPEDGDFDTVGGFVYTELARVPKQHESLVWEQVKITVLEADKRKLHRLRIEFEPASSSDSGRRQTVDQSE